MLYLNKNLQKAFEPSRDTKSEQVRPKRRIIRAWLPFVVTVTLLCGLVYLVVQQDYRMNANDPQISLSEEISQDLASAPTAFAQQSILGMLQGPLTLNLTSGKTDIAQSLEPYVIVYDASGKPLAATGELAGNVPSLPSGVFNYVKANGEDRFTWQPQSGVRQAAVVTYFTSSALSGSSSNSSGQYIQSGFVLAGRSLRETEIREGQLGFDTLVFWILALILTFLAVWIEAE